MGSKGTLFLIHWNPSEAEELAGPLISDGWKVETEAEDGARAGKRILSDPPAAVVVYLTRLPSHGRETARYLRETKSGAEIPIVFVGGSDEVVEKTRANIPHANFVRPEGLAAFLSRLSEGPAA